MSLMTNLTLAINATMNAVLYNGSIPFQVTVQQVPVPRIQEPTDALVRITKAALCGSDLHYYRGFRPFESPSGGIGHEAIGYIAEIGDGVRSLSVGDYVIIPSATDDGEIELAPTRQSFFSGLQAEYAVVPVADRNLIPIPVNATSPTETQLDYLLVSDVWPTSWQALDWAEFQAGDSVAVWGLGPVGLLAVYSAKLRGAANIYAIDHVQARLDAAEAIGGVIPINFQSENPVNAIMRYEPEGVMRSIDCVGFEALNDTLALENTEYFQRLINSTHLKGGIALTGVWTAAPSGPKNPRGSLINPETEFPFTPFWSKQLHMQAGSVDTTAGAGVLLRLIESGVAHPSRVMRGVEVPLSRAQEYYQRFEKWEEIKVYFDTT
ncbi:hypothetical protein BLS_006388 [Venturia inaequalis]|uniref:Alcohol dehydrogenase n=1 Tax=Venturia inaequalis TaxID=5025 RepID=A0A8H3V4C1_VENIN|nr:hypothetical protein BLS_006388 [Venturia inaequalis]RDI85873.1 hypothetical protein Vi05172_g4036 [Venturia inaequalis]